jgi:hypothetical protein
MPLFGIDSSTVSAGLSSASSPTPRASGRLTPNTTALLEISPGASLPAATSAAPEIVVTLGGASEPSSIYSNSWQGSASSMAWAQPPADTISKVMEDNLKTHARSGRLTSLLSGLGSELLQGLSGRPREWQQSAVLYRPGYREPGSASPDGVSAAEALRDAGEVGNALNLKIRTKSGKEIDIAIAFGGDGKAVQNSLSIRITVSKELDANEQAAIDKLAKGLDTALQGIAGDTPKIDISGLVGLDTAAIAGVDLSLRTTDQRSGLRSFEFHADATGRSIDLQTATGRLVVDVDFSSAPLGSAEQQAAAIRKFLAQFDAANVRAHGEEVLLEQFKAAFSQLNSSYPPPAARPATALPEWVLGENDRAVLTGLSDFEASMSGDFDNGSPSRAVTEAGNLRYEVAQKTQIKGVAKESGLSLVQTQTETLRATQERSPREGVALNKESGTYDVFHILDKHSTTTAFEYDDFALLSASAEENTSRLDRYEKWVDNELVERRSTPYGARVLRDLMEELRTRS